MDLGGIMQRIHWSEDRLKDIFVGRKIVSVDTMNDTMTLDDGTVLGIDGNDGCACANGNYSIEHLATVDNVILNVETEIDTDEYGDDGDVRMFVYTAHEKLEAIRAEGCDNGYYGTGFWIKVQDAPVL